MIPDERLRSVSRVVMWRHGWPRIIARTVLSEFREQGIWAGLRMSRRALWLMFSVPFASPRR